MQKLNNRLIPFVTDYRLFDFLRENHKKPYSRIQALCDILTKAAINYKSPLKRTKEDSQYSFGCSITITDLAYHWRWHRQTVRNFLDQLDSFGVITRKRCSLYEHIVINKCASSYCTFINKEESYDVQTILSHLSLWLAGQIDDRDLGKLFGQILADKAKKKPINQPLDLFDDSGQFSKDGSTNCTDNQRDAMVDTILLLVPLAAFTKELLQCSHLKESLNMQACGDPIEACENYVGHISEAIRGFLRQDIDSTKDDALTSSTDGPMVTSLMFMSMLIDNALSYVQNVLQQQ